MFENYKEAKAIALYDSNVIIAVGTFEHAFHGDFGLPETHIYIRALEDLARCFDLPFDKKHLGQMQNLPLFDRDSYWYLSDAENGCVEKILVKLDGQFLSIIIIERWIDDEEVVVNREILYSGKFSIDFGEVRTAE